MANRRLKVVWSGASGGIPGPWKAGLWSVYVRDPGSRIEGFAISVRGGLAWCAGLAFAGYVCGAAALFLWLQRNPYNLVGFADTLLMPVRWSHVRELRGRAMIEEGLADLRARRWAEANMKLRAGLSRDPHDLRARLALAQFYTLANRRPAALTTLSEDLAAGYPGRSYLATLFTLAAQGEDYDVVIAACDRFLPTERADRAWLLTQKLQALIGAGRAAEALKLAEAEGEGAGAMVNETRVLALLELGRSAEAVAFLSDWRRRAPASDAQVLRLQARAFRDARRFREMDAALEELRERAPTDPRTYVYGVVQKFLAGQQAEAAAGLEDYIRRFSGGAQNLALMASALGEAKAPALVQRCMDEAALHGFPAKPFETILLQTQMAAGDWPDATRTLAALKPLMKSSPPSEQFAVTWIERVLAVASRPDEEPQAQLLEFLQQRPVPMRLYRQTCDALVRAARFATARSVLELADRTYPASRALAAIRVRVDEALKPPAMVAVAVVAPLGSVTGGGTTTERAFFQKLAEAERAERWPEAAQWIREIRVAQLAWLERREADVLDAQMRVAAHTGDTLELLGAAKLYLDGSNDRATRVVAIARELGGRGAKEDGELLLNEVLRKIPGFPPASRLQKEWHPPPPTAKH